MLSHYYFFCSFCAQKYVHNFCVYIRFSRNGVEKHNKKVSPHSASIQSHHVCIEKYCMLYDP